MEGGNKKIYKGPKGGLFTVRIKDHKKVKTYLKK